MMFSDLHLSKELPRLPRTVPRGVKALCYASRILPRGYGRIIPYIARLSPSLHEVTLQLEDVGQFVVDLRESVCAPLFARGCYTHQLPEDIILNSVCREGMTVFDIGANIGYYTSFFSRRVGVALGKVVAVEPMPRALALLAKNKSLNVEIVESAIGREPGKARLHQMSSLDTSFVEFGFGRAQGVSVTTIDELSNKYGAPDLIKIDVEGAELAALEGARNTLTTASPPFVMFEYIDDNAQKFGSYGLEDIAEMLSPDYAIVRVIAPGRLAPMRQCLRGVTNDYLAIPLSRQSSVSSLLYVADKQRRGRFESEVDVFDGFDNRLSGYRPSRTRPDRK